MAPTIQVSVQVAILFCLVTASMGGIKDWQKEFVQLENKVKVQQEEIKSVYWMMEQFEKRLKPLEEKGEMLRSKYNLQLHVEHVHLHLYGFHQSANLPP